MLGVLKAKLLVVHLENASHSISGVMDSQKSLDTDSISEWLAATPPVQVRRRSSAREAESDTSLSVAGEV